MGEEISKFLRIIYAGPVSEHNAKELIKLEDIDGFLVHNGAAMSKEFETIVNDVNSHFQS